jgi:flavorubredoxin
MNASSSLTELAAGSTYALHNVIALDGRVGHYPSQARGYAPCNCYLLVEDDEALLLDTGFGIHKDQMLSQIGSLIGPDTSLSIMVLRLNDFLSVGNALPIARHFPIKRLFATIKNAAAALDFESTSQEEAEANAGRFPVELITGNEWVEIGSRKRPVKFNQSPLRLINTRWVYDPASKTLFTSDMFAHSWSESMEPQWSIDAGADETTEEDVRRFLLSTRYWWLEGARTDELRRGIDAIFDAHDIENIAPGYGKLLRGRQTVERHYRMRCCANSTDRKRRPSIFRTTSNTTPQKRCDHE